MKRKAADKDKEAKVFSKLVWKQKAYPKFSVCILNKSE